MAECSLPSLPSLRSLQAPKIQPIQHTSTLSISSSMNVFNISILSTVTLQLNVQEKYTYELGTKQFVQQHICFRSEPGGGEEYVARAC